MLKLMVLVAALNSEPIFKEVNVPKEIVGSFYQLDKNIDKLSCLVHLKENFTDKTVDLYDRSILYSTENCDKLRERFYK